MTNEVIQPSQVVIRLCNLASQGRYNVTPPEAREMNTLFDLGAKLINQLEAAEAAEEESNDEESV